jgi:hypothetical protein
MCSAKVLSQEDSKSIDLVLQGAKKALSFTSSIKDLIIHVANFYEKKFAHCLNSLKLNPKK